MRLGASEPFGFARFVCSPGPVFRLIPESRRTVEVRVGLVPGRLFVCREIDRAASRRYALAVRHASSPE